MYTSDKTLFCFLFMGHIAKLAFLRTHATFVISKLANFHVFYKIQKHKINDHKKNIFETPKLKILCIVKNMKKCDFKLTKVY